MNGKLYWNKLIFTAVHEHPISVIPSHICLHIPYTLTKAGWNCQTHQRNAQIKIAIHRRLQQANLTIPHEMDRISWDRIEDYSHFSVSNDWHAAYYWVTYKIFLPTTEQFETYAQFFKASDQ